MKPLEIHCRNRVMFAKIESKDKGLGVKEYTLTHKNGFTIYIFRKEMSKWRHVYGELDDDIKEAILDALILRFGKPTKMFYFRGERMVVEVSWVNGGGGWHIYGNNYFIGSITYNELTDTFRCHITNPVDWLTNTEMDEYISMIRRGEIEWPNRN